MCSDPDYLFITQQSSPNIALRCNWWQGLQKRCSCIWKLQELMSASAFLKLWKWYQRQSLLQQAWGRVKPSWSFLFFFFFAACTSIPWSICIKTLKEKTKKLKNSITWTFVIAITSVSQHEVLASWKRRKS